MRRQKVQGEAEEFFEADSRSWRTRAKSRRQRELPDWDEEHVGSSYTSTPRTQRESLPEAPQAPEVPSVRRSRSRASRISSTPHRAASSRTLEMDDMNSTGSSSTMPPAVQETRQQLAKTSIHGRIPLERKPSTASSSDRTEEPVRSQNVSNRSRNVSPKSVKSVKSAKSTRSRKSARPFLSAHPPLGSPAYSESGSDASTPDAYVDDYHNDDFQVEILDADDELSKDRSRVPSRDAYTDSRESSVEDRRRFRRRRARRPVPAYSEDELRPFRRHSVSDVEHSAPVSNARSASRSAYARSPARSVHRSASRSLGRSHSRSAPHSRAPSVYSSQVQLETPQHSRTLRPPDMMMESRPPIVTAPRSSNHRSIGKQVYRPTPEVVYHDPPPRRSNTTVDSNRSRSSSRRPASLFGSIFGTPGPRSSPEKPLKRVDCIICLSDYPVTKAPKLHCGHRMCHSCLRRSFQLSVKDPSHMPPKCCDADHIPLKYVEKLFDNSFKKQWNRKFHEFSTRNRIYCPSRKCGEWIKPSHIRRENGRKVARCGRCRTKVCGVCNNKWHSAPDCPRDEETNQFLAQAEDEGWKRCYKCKAMVELKEGCNHMTCRCGGEFCMICGTKWKGCDCPWFNYDSMEAGDQFDHMNVPVPHIRGNMHDIFDGEGPPTPAELRDQPGFAPPFLHHGRRPQTFDEEMLRRRHQEEEDLAIARRMMLYDDFDQEEPRRNARAAVIDDVFGIGKAPGYHPRDHFRRDGYNRPVPPRVASPPPLPLERMNHQGTETGRTRARGGSMERRLADRLSGETRGGLSSGMHPLAPMRGHGHPMAPMAPIAPMMASPMASPSLGGDAPPLWGMPPMRTGGLTVRPRAATEGYYDAFPFAPRRSSERGGSRKLANPYDEEADFDAPESSSGIGMKEKPRSSSLAGLTGHGRGMNRVFEWMHWVEPGVPEEFGSVRSY